MKGIEDAVAGEPPTTIHSLDLNPTTAATEKPAITIDSKSTVRTDPLIAANNTYYDAITISTVG